MSDPKKVVVVGGGATGRMVIKQLKGSKGLQVTLVQATTTSEVAWYITEVMTGQKVYEQCSTSEPMAGPDKIVYGVATGVCDGKIAVKTPEGNTEEVEFDYLVSATGIVMPTITPEPGEDPTARRTEVEDLAKALSDPKKHVVVAGGGAVGVELVGDIIDGGNQNVTLITPGDRLLLDLDEKYSKKALDALKRGGATVMFGERISSHTDTVVAESGGKVTLKTTGDKTIECDVYVPAYSRGPRSSWLTQGVDGSQLPEGLMNDRGRVLVDDFLASKAYPKLYVIGAASSVDEPALIANMDSQAQCIAKNIAKEKSAKYGGGMVAKPIFQLVGHKSYGFFAPEGINAPGCMKTCMCWVCGFPINLLCPCVWCGIACGPCTTHTCGTCCSDPEGKGVAMTIGKSAKLGLAADMAGFNGIAKVAPQEMKR